MVRGSLHSLITKNWARSWNTWTKWLTPVSCWRWHSPSISAICCRPPLGDFFVIAALWPRPLVQRSSLGPSSSFPFTWPAIRWQTESSVSSSVKVHSLEFAVGTISPVDQRRREPSDQQRPSRPTHQQPLDRLRRVMTSRDESSINLKTLTF